MLFARYARRYDDERFCVLGNKLSTTPANLLRGRDADFSVACDLFPAVLPKLYLLGSGAVGNVLMLCGKAGYAIAPAVFSLVERCIGAANEGVQGFARQALGKASANRD